MDRRKTLRAMRQFWLAFHSQTPLIEMPYGTNARAVKSLLSSESSEGSSFPQKGLPFFSSYNPPQIVKRPIPSFAMDGASHLHP